MKSRFPVAFVLVALVLAAFWYDATFAVASSPAQAAPADKGTDVALAR
jgi:hypothetical protein